MTATFNQINYNAANYNSTVTDLAADVLGQITITVLAKQIIRITYSQDILANGQESVFTNYNISAASEGADEVVVDGVRGYITDHSLSVIDLSITNPTLGATYHIEIADMRTPTDQNLIELSGNFVARITKSDTMHQVFPNWYSLKTDGILSNLILALSIEDEKVGGRDSLGTAPAAVASVASTFGTMTLGTDTLGS